MYKIEEFYRNTNKNIVINNNVNNNYLIYYFGPYDDTLIKNVFNNLKDFNIININNPDIFYDNYSHNKCVYNKIVLLGYQEGCNVLLKKLKEIKIISYDDLILISPKNLDASYILGDRFKFLHSFINRIIYYFDDYNLEKNSNIIDLNYKIFYLTHDNISYNNTKIEIKYKYFKEIKFYDIYLYILNLYPKNEKNKEEECSNLYLD